MASARFSFVSLSAFSFVSLALASSIGCGAGDREFVPVAGRVTLDGQPLANGSVSFQPMATGGETSVGQGSVGKCDEDGRFTLETIDGQIGAVPANHRVRIFGPRTGPRNTAVDDAPNTGPGEIVPRKYNYASELVMTIPPTGTDEANFDLVTK